MRLLTCLLALAAFVSPSMAVTIVDFEDWTGGENSFTSVDSSGYRFESVSGRMVIRHQSGTNNPTNALQTGIPFDDGKVQITQIGGGSFSLLNLDLAESPFFAYPSASIKVTGFFQEGGTIVEVFVFDGDMNTFETFYPMGFTDLSSVVLDADGSGIFRVDNLVVPEPVTMIFFIVATAGLAATSKKKIIS